MQRVSFPLFSFFFLILLSAISQPVLSQQRCGTVEYMEYLRNQRKIKQTDEQFEQWLDEKSRMQLRPLGATREQSGPYEIPVVIHVIHNEVSVGVEENISDAQILSQIDVINKDFKRLNDDAINTPDAFELVAGSMDIEFVLARRAPNGMPTTGINRVFFNQESWSMSEEEEFKALSYWPSQDYLNIWIIRFSGSFIGYAQFPVSTTIPGLEDYTGGMATTDGVVIDYTVFGSDDYGNFDLDPQYNKGRTLTHELGHFLGLRHIWGDDGNSCMGTDYVGDTPNQSDETTFCPSTVLTDVCASLPPGNMYQNFLDYTDDACMNLFTQGQIARMETILEDSGIPRRNSLLTSPGLLPPDCDIVDAEILKLVSPGAITCSTSSPTKLLVRNLSCDPITSLKITYSVNGGTPVTIIFPSLSIGVNANAEVSTVGFDITDGVNILTAVIDEVNGEADGVPSNSTLSTSVLVDPSTDYIPLREEFNQLAWPTINTSNGTVWELSNNTNYTPSAAFRAFDAPDGPNESWLATPVLDFSSASEASVFFDLSYAWNGTDNDRLQILASTDCGATYPVSLFNRSGQVLADNETSSGSWLPQSQTEWQQDEFIDLSELAGEENVRLAFVFSNNNGNNIYLDNIEFFVSDDPNPVDPGTDLYTVYWHSDFEASLTFNLVDRSPVRITVLDIMGRRYIDTTAPSVLNQTFPIVLQDAAEGIYIIRVQIGSRFYATKVFIAP